ncbi:hypothetical protein CBL_14345 [Carabus blaptoides fortunei]
MWEYVCNLTVLDEFAARLVSDGPCRDTPGVRGSSTGDLVKRLHKVTSLHPAATVKEPCYLTLNNAPAILTVHEAWQRCATDASVSLLIPRVTRLRDRVRPLALSDATYHHASFNTHAAAHQTL